MVHPLVGAVTTAITLGMLIGGALFVYFQSREQHNTDYSYVPPPDTSYNPNENSCAICLDSLERPNRAKKTLKCGHAFHADCIQRWFNQSAKRCPVCRCFEE